MAAAALLAYSARPVRAQVVPPAPPCNNIVGTTVTCTGNVSAGIATAAPYTVLNVNTLTANIAPASGVDGINFTSLGNVAINSNTGAFAIVTTGAGADGIEARSGLGTVTVNSTGDITSTNGRGIYAQSAGSTVDVTSKGTINANSAYGAIFARGSGAVTVDSTGDITAPNGPAIFAFSTGSTVVVTHHSGTITANPDCSLTPPLRPAGRSVLRRPYRRHHFDLRPRHLRGFGHRHRRRHPP